MLKITYIFGGSKNNSKYLTKVSIFSAQQKFFFILEEVIYFDKSLGTTQRGFQEFLPTKYTTINHTKIETGNWQL